MPERRQFAVAAFHPRARQVEQRHPAAGQMAASQFGLDIVLVVPAASPSPRRPRPWRPRPPPGRTPRVLSPHQPIVDSFEAGRATRDTMAHRPGPAAGTAAPAAPGSPGWRAIWCTAATCPCGSDPVTSTAAPAPVTGLAGQHQPHRLDRIVWQVRQVRQGLLADLAAIPVGTAQQVPLRRPARSRLSEPDGYATSPTCIAPARVSRAYSLTSRPPGQAFLVSTHRECVTNAIRADQQLNHASAGPVG